MTPSDPRSLTEYQRAAASLRGSLRRNRWDSMISLRPGARIHYIFDTNVFLFHANLEDTSNQMEDLASLLGVDIKDSFLEAMERLTADYMFSGHLPAQGGEPVYLSNPHFDEVVDNTFEIERLLSGRVPTIDPEMRARIRHLLSSPQLGSRERLLELQSLIPAAWLGSLRAQAHLKDVLDAAFIAEPPKVMPLHHVKWGWDAGRPLDIDLKIWSDALGEAGPNRDRNQDNDARTIATIVDLYRNDASSRFDGRKTLYLFVTTDLSIAHAVTNRASQLRPEGIPYFVRSPRDFSPLLNIQSMGNVYARNRSTNPLDLQNIFHKLSVALDWIEFDPSKDRSRLRMADATSSPLEGLQHAWRALSETSTFLNAEYFEKSNRELFKGLAQFISDTYDDSVQALKTTIEDVRLKHITAVLDSALAKATSNGDRRARALTRRAQLKLIGTVFDGLLDRKKTIGAFVDQVIARRALDGEIEDKIASDPGRANVAMLVACLFLAAEDWDAAADFAAQAVGKLDEKSSPAIVVEAAYLRALCLRFSMHSDRDFLKARRQLERNLNHYRETPLGDNVWRNIRDRIERATLYLSAATMQAITIVERNGPNRAPRRVNYVPEGHEQDYFNTGTRDSEAALAELADNFADHGLPKSRMRELYLGLEIQATTNLAAAWIFAAALPNFRHTPQTSRAEVLDRLVGVIEMATAEGRPLREAQHIYALVLRSLESSVPAAESAFGIAALNRIRSLMQIQGQMPVNDRLRFGYLAEWLTSLGVKG